MKRLLLCLIVFTSALQLKAQTSPQWAWGRQGQGSWYDDAFSVSTDGAGNVYSVGYYASDTMIIGSDTMMNAGSTDFFIVKYDEFGSPQWTMNAGGSGEEYGNGVFCDPAGFVMVVGTYSSATITFGAYTLINNGAGTPDVFIVRFAPNGNVVWAESIGGMDWDYVGGVYTDANYNTYVTGAYYNSTMIFGTDTFPNRGSYDFFLVKMDPNGNPVWGRSAGGNHNDLGNAITMDDAGQIYVSGGFASDTLAYPSDTLINAFGSQPDIFTVRYDYNGNCNWARREGSVANDHAVAITWDQTDGLYVAGHYHSASIVIGNDTLMNMGMGDPFIIKYDTAGTVQWAKGFGGTDNDFGFCLASFYGGPVLFGGMFQSAIMMVGSNTVMNANSSGGIEDMFIVQYDALGNEMYILRDGGLGSDYINSMAIGPAYQIYIAGSFGSPTMTCYNDVLTNSDTAGSSEALIGRMDYPLSIDATQQSSSVAVYPNPGNGVFNFASAENIESIMIYNSLGEIISEVQNVHSKFYSADISNESNGMYFYSIITSADEITSGTLLKF